MPLAALLNSKVMLKLKKSGDKFSQESNNEREPGLENPEQSSGSFLNVGIHAIAINS